MNLSFIKKSIAWLATVGLLPASITVSSWLVTSSIERSKLDAEYVKIAIAILATPDKDGNTSQVALRSWAVRLLNAKSPEKFTYPEQVALGDLGIEIQSLMLMGAFLKSLSEGDSKASPEDSISGSNEKGKK